MALALLILLIYLAFQQGRGFRRPVGYWKRKKEYSFEEEYNPKRT